MRARGNAASNRASPLPRPTRGARATREEAPQNPCVGYSAGPSGGRRWAPASAVEQSWRGYGVAAPRVRPRRWQTAPPTQTDRQTPRGAPVTVARASRESVVRAVAAHLEATQPISGSAKSLRAKPSSPTTSQRALDIMRARASASSAARPSAVAPRRSAPKTEAPFRRGSIPPSSPRPLQVLPNACRLSTVTLTDEGRSQVQKVLQPKKSRRKVISYNECPMCHVPSDKPVPGNRMRNKVNLTVQREPSISRGLSVKDSLSTRRIERAKTSNDSISKHTNKLDGTPIRVSNSGGHKRASNLRSTKSPSEIQCNETRDSPTRQVSASPSCTTLALNDDGGGGACGSVNTGHVGWEKVLLSVQVQLSPICSPTSSVVPLMDTFLPRKRSSSNTRCKFKTASEILVLPILTRPYCGLSSIRISNQTSDPGIGRDFAEWSCLHDSVTHDALESRKFDKRKTSSETRPNFCEASENFQESVEVKEQDRQAISVPSCHKENDLVPFGVEEALSDTDSSVPERVSHSTNAPAKLALRSSEDRLVAELRIDQNDIVKMAYDIVNLVSRSHVAKSSQSLPTHLVKIKNNFIRHSISLNSIFDHSKSIALSTRKMHSLKNVSEILTDKNSFVRFKSKNVSFLENTDYKDPCTDVPCVYESSVECIPNVSSEDVEHSSTAEHSTTIPILLYQNEQVRKILNNVATKFKQPHSNLHNENFVYSELHSKSEPSNMENYVSTKQAQYTRKFLPKTEVFLLSSTTEKRNVDNNSVLVSLSEKSENKYSEKQVISSASQKVAGSNKDSSVNDDSAVSEAETEISLMDSEVGADDGDDEDTSVASDGARQQGGTAPGAAPLPPTAPCPCRETPGVCPRHPAEDGDSAPAGRCLCERFREVCVPDRVVADTGEPTHPKAADEVSLPSPVHHSDDEWIPWTTSQADGNTIPDFVPGRQAQESSVTLPPHEVRKTTNIFDGPPDDDVSVFNEAFAVPGWLESSRDEGVPDTITEFHWMPDNVRGFSSTILTPEIPDDLQEDSSPRPSLGPVAQQGQFESSISSSSNVAHNRGLQDILSSETGRATINRDAPREVPQSHSPTLPSLGSVSNGGGPLLQVITTAVEKTLTPLQSAILELKEKILMLESSQSPNLKPDILVGVGSMTPCPGHTNSEPAGNFLNNRCYEGHEGLSTSPCGYPFGIYILRQHTNRLPTCGNLENIMEGTSPIPILCFHCSVERDRPSSSEASVTPNPDGNADDERNSEAVATPDSVPPPSQSQSSPPQSSQPPSHNLFASSEEPECCKTIGDSKAESQAGSSIQPSKTADCCKLMLPDEPPQSTSAGQPVQPSNISDKCDKCDICGPVVMPDTNQKVVVTAPDCKDCCRASQPTGPTQVGDASNVTSNEKGRLPDCCTLPTHETKPQTSVTEPRESAASSPEAREQQQQQQEQQPQQQEQLPSPEMPTSSAAGEEICPDCEPCVNIFKARARYTEPISETTIPLRGKHTHIPCAMCVCSPSCQCGVRPLKPAKQTRISVSQIARPQSERCPGCSSPNADIPEERKPSLSPIAQMYLDMSKSKYDWSDEADTPWKRQCPAFVIEETDTENQDTSNDASCPRNVCPGDVKTATQPDSCLTLRFPRSLRPDIDICLNDEERRLDSCASSSRPDLPCFCGSKH